MNIQEEIKGTISDTRNDGKKSSENEDKKPTARTRPLEKCCPETLMMTQKIMQFKIPLIFGSTGTPQTLMTLNYFNNM